MDADEIDSILRIQWRSLHNGPSYVEDYYYQVCAGTPLALSCCAEAASAPDFDAVLQVCRVGRMHVGPIPGSCCRHVRFAYVVLT
jgi:hypothetical protein